MVDSHAREHNPPPPPAFSTLGPTSFDRPILPRRRSRSWNRTARKSTGRVVRLLGREACPPISAARLDAWPETALPGRKLKFPGRWCRPHTARERQRDRRQGAGSGRRLGSRPSNRPRRRGESSQWLDRADSLLRQGPDTSPSLGTTSRVCEACSPWSLPNPSPQRITQRGPPTVYAGWLKKDPEMMKGEPKRTFPDPRRAKMPRPTVPWLLVRPAPGHDLAELD